MTLCVAGLLSLPVAMVADDHGQRGGSGGGSTSTDRHGDDHGNDGTQPGAPNHDAGDNHGGANQSAPGAPGTPGNTGEDNHGGDGNVNQPMQRTRVNLAATAAGTGIGAEGHADLRAQGNDQRLTVEVEANVPDGTMFTVTANDIPIGTITVKLGEGEFEFESNSAQPLAGGMMPSAITSIVVSDSSNTPVLQATFGAITSSNPGLPPVLAMRKDLHLTATAAGAAVSAEGNVDLRSQGADTRLKVEVEAKVADGTVWTVSANGGAVNLGSVTFHLMEAELRLEAADLLQAGVTDPSSLTTIEVKDAGAVVTLSGTF